MLTWSVVINAARAHHMISRETTADQPRKNAMLTDTNHAYGTMGRYRAASDYGLRLNGG